MANISTKYWTNNLYEAWPHRITAQGIWVVGMVVVVLTKELRGWDIRFRFSLLVLLAYTCGVESRDLHWTSGFLNTSRGFVDFMMRRWCGITSSSQSFFEKAWRFGSAAPKQLCLCCVTAIWQIYHALSGVFHSVLYVNFKATAQLLRACFKSSQLACDKMSGSTSRSWGELIVVGIGDRDSDSDSDSNGNNL